LSTVANNGLISGILGFSTGFSWAKSITAVFNKVTLWVKKVSFMSNFREIRSVYEVVRLQLGVVTVPA
jgi:hypothetical protein